MSNDEIFVLYQAARSDLANQVASNELIVALRRHVRRWAEDVLGDAPSWLKNKWRDDLIGVGYLKLCSRTKRLLNRHVVDGKHFVNSLRLSVRNAMRAAFHRRSVVPLVTPE